MSSLFSIGEDELDIDDEDCLLVACEIGNQHGSVAGNSNKTLGSHPSQSNFQVPLLRMTGEGNRIGNSRKPFESIGNITPRGSSVMRTDSSKDNVTPKAKANECNINGPLAKRFALDNSPAMTHGNFNGSRFPKSSTTTCATSNSNLQCGSTKKNSSYDSFSCQTKSLADSGHSQLKDCLINEQTSLVQKSHLSSIQIPQIDKQGSLRTGYTSRAMTDTYIVPVSMSPACSHAGVKSASSCINSDRQTAGLTKGNCQQNSSVQLPSATKHKDATLDVSNIPKHTSPLSFRKTGKCFTDSFNKSVNSSGNSKLPQTFKKTLPVNFNHFPAKQTVTPNHANKSLVRTPSNGRTPRLRKFPGPAGLLPKLNPGQNLDQASLASPLQVTRKASPVQTKVPASATCSSDDEDFSTDPWSQMYQDFMNNVPMTMRYTIVRVYSEAIQQKLARGKVPCLCALVKTFSLTEADASVLLKDPTGEIHGTLHRKVLEDYQSELLVGAGLVLKHVSVFSPSPRKHYLNITPGNILQIYPPDPQFVTCSQPLASQCTQRDEARQDLRDKIAAEVVAEAGEYCVEQNTKIETANLSQEELLIQEECFGDLLQDLDDDDDLLEALLL